MARRALPDHPSRPDGLRELRVPVPDRPGVLADITTLAAELGVNIIDLEIAHSVEGERGVLVLVVDGHLAPTLVDGLGSRGYRSTSVDRVGPVSAGPPGGVLEVTGGGSLAGTVRVPGDKSISHRALLLAALADGESTVEGLSDGDDVARTGEALAAWAPPSRASAGPARWWCAGGGPAWRRPTSRWTWGTPGPGCGCSPGWWPASRGRPPWWATPR